MCRAVLGTANVRFVESFLYETLFCIALIYFCFFLDSTFSCFHIVFLYGTTQCPFTSVKHNFVSEPHVGTKSARLNFRATHQIIILPANLINLKMECYNL